MFRATALVGRRMHHNAKHIGEVAPGETTKYVCTICNRRYELKDSLRSHTRIKHVRRSAIE